MPKLRRGNDAKLSKYVYRHARGILYRPYGGKGQRRRAVLLLPDRDATEADIWAAYQSYVTADRTGTLGWLLDEYLASPEFERRAERTRVDQRRQAEAVKVYPLRGGRVFGDVKLRDITPGTITKYLDARAKKGGAVAGNREKALISKAWSWARARDLVIVDNPCRVAANNPERPRSRDVSDDEYRTVYELADPMTRAAMALAALTGLRQGDLLALQRRAATAEGIAVFTGKTSRPLVIVWTPALEVAWSDALTARTVASLYVICTERGQKYTGDGWRSNWDRLQRRAVAAGVLKDRYTWNDLRAYAAGRAEDWRLLGHQTPATFERVYNRRARRVRPSG